MVQFATAFEDGLDPEKQDLEDLFQDYAEKAESKLSRLNTDLTNLKDLDNIIKILDAPGLKGITFNFHGVSRSIPLEGLPRYVKEAFLEQIDTISMILKEKLSVEINTSTIQNQLFFNNTTL